MKNKKKISYVLLLVVGILLLTACGKNGGILSSKSLKASDLNIEDYEWETNASKCNGADCYVLSLINNSKYDIIGVDFTYKVKSGVSEADLDVYDDFMQDHEGYIDEDDSPKNVTLRGSKNALVKQGDELTDLHFTVGYNNYSWYDYPTDEQFALMEPKEIQLGIISENKLYIAYYNFSDKSWKIDETIKDVDVWSNKEIAKKLPKIEEDHHVVITDDEDEFEIYAYGISEDMFNQYVEELKEAGYEEDTASKSHFESKSLDGNIIDAWYYEEDSRLSISIEKE